MDSTWTRSPSTSRPARSRPVATRNARLLRLADRLRDEAGQGYALGAIVPSPRLLDLYPQSWPGFPYKRLAKVFDVFLPMAYWTFHAPTLNDARAYARDSVSGIRALDRRPGHRRCTRSEGPPGTPRVQACAASSPRPGSAASSGISIYDFLTTSGSAWREIEARPHGRPRQSARLRLGAPGAGGASCGPDATA